MHVGILEYFTMFFNLSDFCIAMISINMILFELISVNYFGRIGLM